jgi:hypothetical protein
MTTDKDNWLFLFFDLRINKIGSYPPLYSGQASSSIMPLKLKEQAN